MYPQNNFGAGAQWAFATTIVIVVLALTLGVLISNSDWFQPEIALAKADGMNKDNDIAYQKSLVDLEQYQSDAQVAQERRQLMLENQKVADRQSAEFRQNLYATLNSGLFILLSAVGFLLAVWGLTTCLKSYKLALLQADLEGAPRSVSARRRPSLEALHARARERISRQNILREIRNEPQIMPNHIKFLYTRPFWPDDNKNEKHESTDLPWAG